MIIFCSNYFEGNLTKYQILIILVIQIINAYAFECDISIKLFILISVDAIELQLTILQNNY